MNPLIGYGILSGVGSLAGSLYNQFSGFSQSKKLMDYQYELQQKAIDAANQYNHPAQQMKRLAEAQLNPNLVYGSGVDGNQASAASPSIVNRRGEMGNPLQDAVQATLQARQLHLSENVAFQNALESKARRQELQAKTLGILSDNRYKDATLETRIKESAQRLANRVTQGEYMTQQVENMAALRNKIEDECRLLVARTGLTVEQARTEVTKRILYRSQTGLNNAKTHLTNKQAKEVDAMIEFIEKGTQLRGQQYEHQEAEYSAKDLYNRWKAEHPKTTITFEIFRDILSAGKDAAGIADKFIP